MSARRKDSPAPLAVLGVAILLPASALFGLWRFAEGRTGEGGEALPTSTTTAEARDPAPALSTPLLSFRRVPGLVARDLNIESFAAAVSSFAGSLDATSCLVVALDGVPVGVHNPNLPVIPASNQKLVTAAAALEVLGAEHSFTTEARATSVAGGVVGGDLYLVGGGDPLLTTRDFIGANIFLYEVTSPTWLDDLADAVVAAGVTRIDGDIVGDGSRYDDVWFQDNWGDSIRLFEAGPISALLVNDSRFGGRGNWQVSEDPDEGAARELFRLLAARGVSIGGGATSGRAPDDAAVVASIQSAPMADVVAELQGTSDNNTTEMLLKELGLQAGDGPTTAAGAAVMNRALVDLGIDAGGFVVADGSGLSNDNRVTCSGLVELLARYQPGDAFAAGLPVAGATGTLDDAFIGTPVEERLVAKTGTLRNLPYDEDPPAVKALSGYLPVEGGGTIQFALILNSTGNLTEQGVYRPIWDELAGVLASYPAGPSAAELGPR